MFPLTSRGKVIAGGVVALILVGLVLGYFLYRPDPPVQQVYHAEVKQPDGSVVAEVKPDPNAKPAAMIPPGSKHTRTIKVTARVKLPTIDIGGSVELVDKVEQLAQMVKASAPQEAIEQVKKEIVAECVQRECPPVTINIDLVQEKDGQQQAVVSSPDGEILATVDIPKENSAAPPRPRNWGIGAGYDPINKTGGLVVLRRIHEVLPVTILGVVNQTREGRLDHIGTFIMATYDF